MKSLWMITIFGAFTCIASNSLASGGWSCTYDLLLNGDGIGRSFTSDEGNMSSAKSVASDQCDTDRSAMIASRPDIDPSHWTCVRRSCNWD